MGEKYFVWDEATNGLTLSGVATVEDEQVKARGKRSDLVQTSNVYCPHCYLILSFHETLSQGEKLHFRKQYLRKVSPNEPDVVILQDVKDLVLFLLATPVTPQFINFFHLPIVDRFLRGLIIYFQYYVQVWEELVAERAATMKKAPNPLARGHRSTYRTDIQCLRSMLGREYADLIVGCHDTIRYHHMVSGWKGGSSGTSSKGEGDLRIFEVLLSVAHRVVWIALQRRYFNLIEIELQRLLRTDSYNTAGRRNAHVTQDMLQDDIQVLHGQKVHTKRKLMRNSALIEDIVYSECDYRLLCLGQGDVNDKRIQYLRDALLVEEERLPELGIEVGILGRNRTDFDVMLMPLEEEKSEEGSERFQRRKTSLFDPDRVVLVREESSKRLPSFQTTLPLGDNFPIESVKKVPDKYESAREEAKRRWIVRELKRSRKRQTDTFVTAIS